MPKMKNCFDANQPRIKQFFTAETGRQVSGQKLMESSEASEENKDLDEVMSLIEAEAESSGAILPEELDDECSVRLQNYLKDIFGLTVFRPNQLQAITATMLGKNCLVFMPTGGEQEKHLKSIRHTKY